MCKKDWKASKDSFLDKKSWMLCRTYVDEDNKRSWTFVVIEMKKYGRKPIYIRVDENFCFKHYTDRAFITIQNTSMTGGQSFTDKELNVVNKAFAEIVEDGLFSTYKKCNDGKYIYYEISRDEFETFVSYCKLVSTNEAWQTW